MPSTWDRALDTRYAPMDDDHHTVVQLLHTLLDRIDQGRPEAIKSAMKAVTQKVVEHFSFEERLMATHRYPRAAEHQEAHASYLADIRRFTVELEKKGLTEGFCLWARGRLVAWFKLHIKTHDIALAQAVLGAAKSQPQP